MDSMSFDIATLEQRFREDLADVNSGKGLAELERRYLGKDSVIREALRNLRHADASSRPQLAARINALGTAIQELLREKETAVLARELKARASEEWIDISMPASGVRIGSMNPVTIVEERCLAILRKLGFQLEEGPEVETEYYCFDALNIPKHHPARDMQDTFFVADGSVLRTHTTSVQARVLQERRLPPVKVVSRGRVFRNEDVDATHLAMFHQLEGFWLDKSISFSNLKWMLRFVAQELFGNDVVIRFKPKFYPYTEPSLGMDVRCSRCQGAGCAACHQAGWLTVIGAGMIHPKVLRNAGYDPDSLRGVAFGWGTTRLASLFFELPEVRLMYQQDIRFLRTLSQPDL